MKKDVEKVLCCFTYSSFDTIYALTCLTFFGSCYTFLSSLNCNQMIDPFSYSLALNCVFKFIIVQKITSHYTLELIIIRQNQKQYFISTQLGRARSKIRITCTESYARVLVSSHSSLYRKNNS